MRHFKTALTATIILTALTLTPGLCQAEEMLRSGPSEERVNLVFIAEGYAEADRAKFIRDTDKILALMKTKLPFSGYIKFFNVHRVYHPSPKSNINISGVNNTRYKTSQVSRSTVLSSKDLTKAYNEAIKAVGKVDHLLMVCNAGRKGGTARGPFGWVTNYGAFEHVALHELGHMMANLADEYINDPIAFQKYGGYYAAKPGDAVWKKMESYVESRPNVTMENTLQRLPWKHWVAPGTQVPAKSWKVNGVSAWEGGAYASKFIYRPRMHCSMTAKDQNAFCEVCKEHFIRAFYRRSKPHKVQTRITSDSYVVTVKTITANPKIEWSYNNQTGKTITIPRDAEETKTVTLTITDATPLLRDPKLIKAITTSYVIKVQPNKQLKPAEPKEPEVEEPEVEEPQQQETEAEVSDEPEQKPEPEKEPVKKPEPEVETKPEPQIVEKPEVTKPIQVEEDKPTESTKPEPEPKEPEVSSRWKPTEPTTQEKVEDKKQEQVVAQAPEAPKTSEWPRKATVNKVKKKTWFGFRRTVKNIPVSWSAERANLIVGHVRTGDSITVTGPAKNGYYPIDFQGRTAYLPTSYLTLKKAETRGMTDSLGGAFGQ